MFSESASKKEFMPDVDAYCIAGESPPLILEGIYCVQCDECKEVYYQAYNSNKLLLRFRIIEGQYESTELCMFINLTDPRTGKRYKEFTPNTAYYVNWVVANNENLPPRKDRMSYRIFKNKIFEAKVRTTKRRFHDGMAMPKCLNYSVIDYLIKRLP
jgi:hypothetical protein